MVRSSLLATTILSVVLATACHNDPTDPQKANTAQTEANEKSAAAVKEAEDKVKKARAEADEIIAAARADFMKTREDYRHTTTTNLVDLDHKVADLTAEAKRATGKKRADLDANLKQIHASRELKALVDKA